jgi:hypothetical protein
MLKAIFLDDVHRRTFYIKITVFKIQVIFPPSDREDVRVTPSRRASRVGIFLYPVHLP